MKEPPDPGGIVPSASEFITITTATNESDMNIPFDIRSNDSSIDTDGSYSQSRPNKRIHLHKKCRHSNKKKKSLLDINKQDDCLCLDSEIIVDKKTSVPQSSLKFNTKPNITPTANSVFKETESTSNTVKVPTPVGRSLYTDTDFSPFIIHVQRIQSSPNDGTTIHPVTFGKFLKSNSIKNIINGSLKRIGRNRITLSFSAFSDANLFLNHNSLESNKLRAFIPTFSVTRMGLVRGVPNEWTPEEIIENINVPIGCGKILKARRINYKTMVDGAPVWKPSQSVVITFDGQVLPKRIFMCFNALPVELYTYPTIQCYNCCRYGHTKIQCRSKPRCYKCGKEHSGESCKVDEDSISCCMCGGNHFATNKLCPEHTRQKEIKVTMANNCISYPEASKIHPPVSRPYSDVLASNILTSVKSSPHKKTNSVSQGYSADVSENGCALKNKNDLDHQSVKEIIIALIKLLSQTHILPSNEVTTLLSFLNLPNSNGSFDNTMELQKYY